MTERNIRAHQVIRVVNLEPIVLPDGESLDYRIDVMETMGEAQRFRVRVYRYEFFRIQSTFPQKRGRPSDQPSDEQIIVADHTCKWDDLVGATPDEIVQAVITKLKEALDL